MKKPPASVSTTKSSSSFTALLWAMLPCCLAHSSQLSGNHNAARSDGMTSALRTSGKHLGSGVFKEEMKRWLRPRTQTALALLQLC